MRSEEALVVRTAWCLLYNRTLDMYNNHCHTAIGCRLCIFYMCVVWPYLYSMCVCVCWGECASSSAGSVNSSICPQIIFFHYHTTGCFKRNVKILYDIILNSISMFTIPMKTFLESTIGDYKNGNISMQVSLLEKQNWYFEERLKKIPIMCWQR